MWYFTWILGLGFAVMFAVMNALWFEARECANDNSNKE